MTKHVKLAWKVLSYLQITLYKITHAYILRIVHAKFSSYFNKILYTTQYEILKISSRYRESGDKARATAWRRGGCKRISVLIRRSSHY